MSFIFCIRIIIFGWCWSFTMPMRISSSVLPKTTFSARVTVPSGWKPAFTV